MHVIERLARFDMNKTIETIDGNVNLWKHQVHEAWGEMTAQ
jgi:hypothetical protein